MHICTQTSAPQHGSGWHTPAARASRVRLRRIADAVFCVDAAAAPAGHFESTCNFAVFIPATRWQGAEEMMAAPMTVGDRVLVEGMAGEIAFLGDDLPGA